MHIIKLNAIDSTNSYLRRLVSKGQIEDFTVVVASKQENGKGQMGTTWQSATGKNLTASIFKINKGVEVEDSFLISQLVSLSVVCSLRRIGIRNLKVKWPNDILADTKKIGGILIENILKGHRLLGSIIGIGLNVNQEDFENLPRASSLKNLSGNQFDVDEVLNTILKELEENFRTLDARTIRTRYHDSLFGNNMPSEFLDGNERSFMGHIRGTTPEGRLVVETEDGHVKDFDLKEIRMLY